MGLLDVFNTKKDPVVIKKTTTIVKKNTVVVKKNDTPKVEDSSVNIQVSTPIVEKPVVEKPAVEQSITTQTTTTLANNEPKLKQYPKLIVCLDPGHAKTTGGKKSPYTLNKVKPALDFYEYKFNRQIANMLVSMLAKYGIEVFITTDEKRDGDIDVSLTTRATRSWNKIKASKKKGVFVSIHANANGRGSEWDKANGWSAFTTKGQNISDKFADCFYDEAEKIFKPKGYTIRTSKGDGDRDWEENFTVIYKTEQLSNKTVPAVLTESFFYTNIKDCTYLISEEGLNDIAQVHLNAILAFADKVYKM